VADKRRIYAGQDGSDVTVVVDDNGAVSRRRRSQGAVYSATPLPDGVAGGWLTGGAGEGPASSARRWGPRGGVPETSSPRPAPEAQPARRGLALTGPRPFSPAAIREGLASFPGIEHRWSFFHEHKGVRFYNDSPPPYPWPPQPRWSLSAAPRASSRRQRQALDFHPARASRAEGKAIFLLAAQDSAK
jgi:UDP-N-acetylmuramoylalanine-D-glutamate ligase